jgi:hypothetical protein|eukprot:TRINITY_DN2005_c0_g1_i1.p1 TRINITY_DN2005_c0_g1~~TRINITY_DN2005_c0_g1_i1.p1  ORF type:complete len:417 (-),score=73.23 TRINITY_DN2005_c0_g1_i1:273-1523(-)
MVAAAVDNARLEMDSEDLAESEGGSNTDGIPIQLPVPKRQGLIDLASCVDTPEAVQLATAADWLEFQGHCGTLPHDVWKEEPAVVCPSSDLGITTTTGLSSSLIFATGEEEPKEENDRLMSENVRLARENEMLRKRNMQLAYGTGPPSPSSTYWAAAAAAAAAAEYGQAGYPPYACPATMAGAPPYYPMPWYNAMCGMSPTLGIGVPGVSPGSWRGGQGRSGGGGCRNRGASDNFFMQDGMVDANGERTRAWSSGDADGPHGPLTTVMLRNLPNNYSSAMLLNLVDKEGFAGDYDFVYLPMDFDSHASLGYAFVNLTSTELAEKFWKAFEGFSDWAVPSQKVCSMSWSHPHQGVAAHTERYRNSPVMHEDVPDEFKPMMFKDGQRCPFPPPTKKLRPPTMISTRSGVRRGRVATED